MRSACIAYINSERRTVMRATKRWASSHASAPMALSGFSWSAVRMPAAASQASMGYTVGCHSAVSKVARQSTEPHNMTRQHKWLAWLTATVANDSAPEHSTCAYCAGKHASFKLQTMPANVCIKEGFVGHKNIMTLRRISPRWSPGNLLWQAAASRR